MPAGLPQQKIIGESSGGLGKVVVRA